MFIKETEGKYRFIETESDVVVKTLESRLYDIEKISTFFGTYYNFNVNNSYDKGKVAEAGVFSEIKNYVNDYFSPEGKEIREAMHLTNRLGLLFTGEPGTGKTFLAGQLSKFLSETQNAIGITMTSPSQFDLGAVVDMARKGDPNRLVVMIWDEFEKDYKKNKNSLEKLLAFLDGVDSRDNVVVIATTNDLSVFPSTLLDRPGRFEKVSEFKIADEVILQNIVEAMIPEKYESKFDKTILVEAAKKIENVSIDKVKSLVRDTLVNVLKGKTGEDIIPKSENKASIPNAKDKTSRAEEQLKSLLKRKIPTDEVRDVIWNKEDNEEYSVSVEELVKN